MASTQVQEKIQQYQAKDFSSLLGMSGFSDALLRNHFKLYEGYVKNSNDIIQILESMTPEAKPSIEYSEVKRRFGFEFCGMRLHELYFGNLVRGGKSLDANGPLAQKINEIYGSFDTWKKHFVATGMMRGVGWAVLYCDCDHGRLMNVWVEQHMINNLPTCRPILVMDVWEHAFMLDYQLDRAKYVDAFIQNINWQEAAKRFETDHAHHEGHEHHHG